MLQRERCHDVRIWCDKFGHVVPSEIRWPRVRDNPGDRDNPGEVVSPIHPQKPDVF